MENIGYENIHILFFYLDIIYRNIIIEIKIIMILNENLNIILYP